MQLSLERLPPLISHLSCIVIGITLSFLLRPESSAGESYVPEKILISLPNKTWTSKQRPQLGSKVHFLKKTGKNHFCILKNVSAIVLQSEPYVVTSLSFKAAGSLPELLSSKNRGLLTLVSPRDAGPYKSCLETKIQYGPHS